MTVRLSRPAIRLGSTQASHVRIERIAAGAVWVLGGHAHAVLEARASGAAPRDVASQEAMIAARCAFLNALEFPIQFVARATPADLGAYAARFERAGAALGEDPLAALAWDHAGLARRLTRGEAVAQHRC